MIVLVKEYGPKRWTLIAKHLKGRTGKQCRERWALLITNMPIHNYNHTHVHINTIQRQARQTAFDRSKKERLSMKEGNQLEFALLASFDLFQTLEKQPKIYFLLKDLFFLLIFPFFKFAPVTFVVFCNPMKNTASNRSIISRVINEHINKYTYVHTLLFY